MANNSRIKGITVEIGGDVSGLDKALKKVNSSINDTQEQLKDVNRLLKLDPSNTELLRQKHQLLSKSVQDTSNRLETLKKAEEQLKQAGVEKNSEQFMALQREIIETENRLKDLQDAANQSVEALAKIGATADKVSAGAQKVADATKGISVAAGGLLGGVVASGMAAAAAADDYNTLAKQTGLSTETLQQAKYAADLIDVSYETFTGSLSKMVSKLRTNEEGFNSLGIATRDASDELLGTEEIFWNSVDALSAMENETARDIAAQELFGRSAADLAGILDDGGAAFRSLGDDAKRAGLIMSQDTLDGLNEVNDQIDTLKAKSQATLSVAGGKALEAMAPVIDRVVEKVSALLEWIGKLDSGQINFLMTVLAVVAAISPLAGGIAKVSSAVSVLSGLMPKLGTVFKAAFTSPITWIIALVALIATKGDEIQAILQKVDDFLQGIFAKDWTEIFGPVLGNILNGFFANVKNIWDSIKSVFDGVIDFIRGVFTGDWSRAWEGVKEIFSGIFKALVSIAKAPLNGIISLLNGAISGLNRMIDGLNSIHFTIPDWVPLLGGKNFGLNLGHISSIPYLASGGILSKGSAIVGDAGPELLTMMGDRAVVQPLNSSTTTNHNLGGVSIVVYGAPGQDVDDLAEAIMYRMQSAVERKEAVFA